MINKSDKLHKLEKAFIENIVKEYYEIECKPE